MNTHAFYVYYFTNTPIPKSLFTEIEQFHNGLQANSTKNAKTIMKYHRAFNVGVYSRLSSAEKKGLCNGDLTKNMELRLDELILLTNQKNFERDIKYADFPTEIDLTVAPNKILKYELYGMPPNTFSIYESPSGSVHLQYDIDGVPFLDSIVRSSWVSVFKPLGPNKKSICWEETTYYISMVHNTVRLNDANANALIEDLNNVQGNDIRLAQAAIVCELNITRNYTGKYMKPYKLKLNSSIMKQNCKPSVPVTVNNIPPYLITKNNAIKAEPAPQKAQQTKTCFFNDSPDNHLLRHLTQPTDRTFTRDNELIPNDNTVYLSVNEPPQTPPLMIADVFTEPGDGGGMVAINNTISGIPISYDIETVNTTDKNSVTL